MHCGSQLTTSADVCKQHLLWTIGSACATSSESEHGDSPGDKHLSGEWDGKNQSFCYIPDGRGLNLVSEFRRE